MMKIFTTSCFILIFLFPLLHAHASPLNSELVLENMGMEPFSIESGDLVTINADVYNAGLKNTNFYTSIITVAYFIDGELFYVDDIGNITPGIQNKIQIMSPPISKTELEYREIKIVLDYHDTLSDQYDSPVDNILKKSFAIDPLLPTTMSLDIFPAYVIQGDLMPKIIISLVESNTNMPLVDKKILLSFDDYDVNLITNKKGQVSISNTLVSLGPIHVEAYFEGDDKYSSSKSSSNIYLFSKEIKSSLIVTILDSQNEYNFEDFAFDVVVFQDSYENPIKKIQPDSAMLLDSKTFLMPLPADHDYFTEIYLDGRLFFVTDKDPLKKNDVLVQELKIPERATIQFEVMDNGNLPITSALIKNWVYSVPVENGSTDWIDVLPTNYGEPYVAEIILSDQKKIQSDPFWLFPGEQKTIDIIINSDGVASINQDLLIDMEIPDWIKNNALWWANGQIDDDSFIQGIQFLIKEGLIKIPVTEQSSIPQYDEIPDWIKNNALWWANGQIDDDSFIQGIQFLIKEGIMAVT